MAECRKLAAEDRLIVVDTRGAWRQYPPAVPTLKEYKINVPEKSSIDTLFASDWDDLRALRETFLEREYLQQLSDSPNNYSLHSAYIYNLLQLGAFERALDHLTVLEKQGAPEQLIWNNRGIILILYGKIAEAVAILQHLLEIYPQDREAQANLQYAQAQLGTLSESAAAASTPMQDAVKGDVVELLLEDLHWK